MATIDDQFVALGASDGAPAIWHSRTGAEWGRTDLRRADFTGSAVAVAGRPGLIVVAVQEDRDPTTRPVFWSRPDPTGPWRPFDTIASVFPDGSRVHALLAYPGGLLAVGAVYADISDGTTGRPALWRSVDGVTWAPGTPPLLDGIAGSLTTAAVSGDSIVVGGVRQVGGGTDGLLLLGDGTNWQLVDTPHLASPDDEYVSAVAIAEGRLVAFGGWAARACRRLQVCDQAGLRVWSSADTREWTSSDPPDLPASINSRGTDLIALASDHDAADSETTVVWSADGLDWQPLTPPIPLKDRGNPQSLAVLGRTVVVVGHARDVALVWTFAMAQS